MHIKQQQQNILLIKYLSTITKGARQWGKFNKIQAVPPATGSVASTAASIVEFSISRTREASSLISSTSELSTVIKFSREELASTCSLSKAVAQPKAKYVQRLFCTSGLTDEMQSFCPR